MKQACLPRLALSQTPNWECYTDAAQRSIVCAYQEAIRSHHCTVSPLYLLAGMLHEENTVAVAALRRCGVERNDLRARLADLLTSGPGIASSADFCLDEEAVRVADAANAVTGTLHDRQIGTEHLLLGLLTDRGEAGELLRSVGVTYDVALEIICDIRDSPTVEQVRIDNTLLKISQRMLLAIGIVLVFAVIRGCVR